MINNVNYRMCYFYIKVKKRRKFLFLVYQTDWHKGQLVAIYPNEDLAKAKVKELKEESKRKGL